MIARLIEDMPARSLLLLAILLAVMIAAPLFASDYLLTVLILILYFAYTGQAWNIMMGFAGQLSLGHAIYVGLAAYVAATLFTRFGIDPWIGFAAAVPGMAAPNLLANGGFDIIGSGPAGEVGAVQAAADQHHQEDLVEQLALVKGRTQLPEQEGDGGAEQMAAKWGTLTN